jgi:hypothetical protein
MVKTKGHTIQWSRQKDIQYNDQDKRTNNTMIKTKGHTIQWSRQKVLIIVLYVLLSWPLYCKSFCLDHCIVCPFILTIVLYVLLSWPLYCMSFCLDHCIVCPSIYDFSSLLKLLDLVFLDCKLLRKMALLWRLVVSTRLNKENDTFDFDICNCFRSIKQQICHSKYC